MYPVSNEVNDVTLQNKTLNGIFGIIVTPDEYQHITQHESKKAPSHF